ncbi:Uncharacterised protein [Nocardia brasiliensis]|nr:Uncharacterised protein [Nocardia brasiliensis]
MGTAPSCQIRRGASDQAPPSAEFDAAALAWVRFAAAAEPSIGHEWRAYCLPDGPLHSLSALR